MVIGFIIGPLIGGTSHIFDGLYSLVIPFAIGMLLTSLNLCLVRWLLVDTFIPAADDVRANYIVQRGLMAVGDTVRAIQNDKLFRLFLGYLATQFSGGAYLQSISLYLAEYFNYGAGKISIFFAAMGVAVLFNLLLIQGYVQRVLSPRTIIRLCALTVACMFGIQLLAIGVLGTPEKSVLEVVVWSSSLLIYGGV